MIDPVWFISYVGAATGAVGVVIAIYLQLISQKHCPPQYVVFYLALGSGLILSHVNGLIVGEIPVNILRLAGYLILIVVQIASAGYIYQRLDRESPDPTLENLTSYPRK